MNHGEELNNNIAQYKDLDKNVISGRYEDRINEVLEENEGSNIFLYIDPYRINALNHKCFDEFALSQKFNSIKLLINLNSFEFIREGGRVSGVKFGDETVFEDLVEYETIKLEKNKESVKTLHEIDGGNY